MKKFHKPITLLFLSFIIPLVAGCITKDKASINADYREEHTIKDYFYLGLSYYKQGEYDRAVSEYSRAIISRPDFAMAYYHRAAAFSHKSQYEKTVFDYKKAIEIDPKFSENFYNRGVIYTEQGQIEIDPKLAEAFYNQGDAYKEKGLCKEAIFDFTKAMEINPDDSHAYNEKAWILATCPDDKYRNGDQAVALAKKAIDMSPKPIYLDTLGAAYAEAGKFESAIAIQEQVIAEIKKTNADKNLIDGCIERLTFYKAQKPWREIR